MAIERWHYGKLILLWGWGLLILLLAFYGLEAISSERFVVGTMLILLIVGIPVSLSVITWRWLGGKEEKNNDEGRPESPKEDNSGEIR